MSLNAFLIQTSIVDKDEMQTNSLINCKEMSPINVRNIEMLSYPSNSFSFGSLNKNGFKDVEIKNVSDCLSQIKPNLHENIFEFKNLNNYYIKYNLYNKYFRSHPKNDNEINSNLLESKIEQCKELGDFSKIPGFESNIIKNNINEKKNNPVFKKIPFLSEDFRQKKTEISKKIIQYPKIVYCVNNNTRPYEPSLTKPIILVKERFEGFSENINIKNNDINGIERQISNINFNIPKNFLIDFNIKGINIKNRQLNSIQENLLNFISVNKAKEFLNIICQKKTTNENLNSINYANEEYLELRNISNENKNDFLKRKRKIDFDESKDSGDEISTQDDKKSKRKKNPLKKKYKKNNKKISVKTKKLNRIKNQKNGEKISLYLNQIQISKTNLENFPFHPILNLKENIKIELLKGIINTNKFIKVNRKAELIEDDRNLKYLKDKNFEIIYQDKEGDHQYILHINGFNILYLIFYYYYHIREDTKLINKLFYCHSSYDKLIRIVNHLEVLIKKCNKLVKEISK